MAADRRHSDRIARSTDNGDLNYHCGVCDVWYTSATVAEHVHTQDPTERQPLMASEPVSIWRSVATRFAKAANDNAKYHHDFVAEVARWLVDIGYGFDCQLDRDAPLPEALRRPLAEAWHEQDAELLGADMVEDVDTFYELLAAELGWSE